MLNGKFYTGLTPKMLNRENRTIKNTQESHFYWPDDTDTESAVETRVRRRASLNIPASERPFIKRQNSTAGSEEVDTKQMLRKEFAKSSIQFFDNICEEEEPQQRRKPLLRSGKQEITLKPTATKLELPNSDTDMAAIKKMHVYDSKVQFYDYVDEDLNNRNNVRKVKIDMNDKKEVERNTKNSPKLQNKRNVNNYIEHEYNNKQETQDNGIGDQYIASAKTRFRAASELRDTKRNNYDSDDIDDNFRKSRAQSVEPKSRYNKYRRDQTPKRILKNTVRNGIDYSDYPECRDEELYNEAIDHVQETIKNVKINGRRAPPRKQVSYSEEEEEIPVRNYFKTNNNEDNLQCRKESNQSKYRNVQSARSNAGSNRRQHREPLSSPDYERSDFAQDQYMELKNNHKNEHNKSITFSNETADSLDELPQKSTTSSVPTSNWSKPNENNNNRSLKHLRSSLCFHDGEIVASDNEAGTAVGQQQRRNARNAATRRVSVGLPD